MSGYSLFTKKVLNDANYTVWIDEAGIRAGHKWRNEIADGIQVHFKLQILFEKVRGDSCWYRYLSCMKDQTKQLAEMPACN